MRSSKDFEIIIHINGLPLDVTEKVTSRVEDIWQITHDATKAVETNILPDVKRGTVIEYFHHVAEGLDTVTQYAPLDRVDEETHETVADIQARADKAESEQSEPGLPKMQARDVLLLSEDFPEFVAKYNQASGAPLEQLLTQCASNVGATDMPTLRRSKGDHGRSSMITIKGPGHYTFINTVCLECRGTSSTLKKDGSYCMFEDDHSDVPRVRTEGVAEGAVSMTEAGSVHVTSTDPTKTTIYIDIQAAPRTIADNASLQQFIAACGYALTTGIEAEQCKLLMDLCDTSATKPYHTRQAYKQFNQALASACKQMSSELESLSYLPEKQSFPLSMILNQWIETIGSTNFYQMMAREDTILAEKFIETVEKENKLIVEHLDSQPWLFLSTGTNPILHFFICNGTTAQRGKLLQNKDLFEMLCNSDLSYILPASEKSAAVRKTNQLPGTIDGLFSSDLTKNFAYLEAVALKFTTTGIEVPSATIRLCQQIYQLLSETKNLLRTLSEYRYLENQACKSPFEQSIFKQVKSLKNCVAEVQNQLFFCHLHEKITTNTQQATAVICGELFIIENRLRESCTDIVQPAQHSPR